MPPFEFPDLREKLLFGVIGFTMTPAIASGQHRHFMPDFTFPNDTTNYPIGCWHDIPTNGCDRLFIEGSSTTVTPITGTTPGITSTTLRATAIGFTKFDPSSVFFRKPTYLDAAFPIADGAATLNGVSLSGLGILSTGAVTVSRGGAYATDILSDVLMKRTNLALDECRWRFEVGYPVTTADQLDNSLSVRGLQRVYLAFKTVLTLTGSALVSPVLHMQVNAVRTWRGPAPMGA